MDIRPDEPLPPRRDIDGTAAVEPCPAEDDEAEEVEGRGGSPDVGIFV